MMNGNSVSFERGNKMPSLQFSDFRWAIPSNYSLVNSHRQMEKPVLNEPDAPKHSSER
jgi:hypothetical protein